MNYRHSFHAGNFADVVKHFVLVRVLLHLLGKDSAFRVIETHAGKGLYDLKGTEASRTNEWHEGIGKLIGQPLTESAAQLIEPYLSLVRKENLPETLRYYPGSPSIASKLCRTQDRMIFCELHPEDYAALHRQLRNDKRAKAVEINGWTALKAYLPPKERRGLVLIDPAFEEADEFEHLAAGLALAHGRWERGIYLLWYPIKDTGVTHAFEQIVATLEIPNILRIKFFVGEALAGGPLNACGMMIVNPPWELEKQLKFVLPALAQRLGHQNKGRYSLAWIA